MVFSSKRTATTSPTPNRWHRSLELSGHKKFDEEEGGGAIVLVLLYILGVIGSMSPCLGYVETDRDRDKDTRDSLGIWLIRREGDEMETL